MKKTVAFIGFHEKLMGLLTNLLQKGYPILVTDKNIGEELYALQKSARLNYPNAELELHACTKECAWESDMLVMSTDYKSLQDLCSNIKNVVTGKIIMTSEDQLYYEQLKTLFPYSKVIWLNKDQVFSEDALVSEKIMEILH